MEWSKQAGERKEHITVYVATPRNFGDRVTPIRRFLSRAEAEAWQNVNHAKLVITTARATGRQLYAWGLGPRPSTWKALAPRSARKPRSRPYRCPHCHRELFGPGRPRKDGSRNVVPQPTGPQSWAEYDGPDPSTLRPTPRPSDLIERPGLAGLFDPRLVDDLPDDW